jgi:nucleoside-diphosphate-sugar epimerase
MSQQNHGSNKTSKTLWSNRRVLVTGGTGFLGLQLTCQLVRRGARVTVALCNEDGPSQIAALPPQVVCQEGDVRHYDEMRQLITGAAPKFVFHLAAVGVNDPFIDEETALGVNTQGTVNVLRAAQRAEHNDIRRIIVTGTSYEYGPAGELDPGNVYAASKVAAWAFCRMYYRAHGTPVVVARPFNAYGPGQNQRALIPSAIRAALNGEDFPITAGEQRRDFIFVRDVIDGLLEVATAQGIEGKSLDLGTGQTTSVRDAVERVFSLCGGSGKPQVGALAYRPGLVWESVADAERTEHLTGWRAKIGLEEGLKATIKAAIETRVSASCNG